MNTQVLELPTALLNTTPCERCLACLQEELSRVEGVVSLVIVHARALMQVEYEPARIKPDTLRARAEQIGANLAAQIDHQTLELKGLDCPDCAATIQKSLRRMPGMVHAEVQFARAQASVEFERASLSLADIRRIVERHGIHAGHAQDNAPAHRQTRDGNPWSKGSLSRRRAATIIAALLVISGLALAAGNIGGSFWLYAGAIVIGGWPIALSALQSARVRALDMNVLVTLAVLGAAGVGDWAEGATVVALFNVGNLMQAGAMERTRRSIRALMRLSPQTARLQSPDGDVEVPVEQVQVGSSILIKPGERIPMDGIVLEGQSAVNQAPITGEAMPIECGPGGTVYAGTLNGAGSLIARVTHAYRDTTLARIAHQVEEAQAQRAPAQEWIDRFARVYTPFVVVLAILVATLPPLMMQLWQMAQHQPAVSGLWPMWFVRALALLLIACPCALVISTPVAIVTAIGSAARNGILIKGGVHLEAMSRVSAILYDKTGTLTQGKCRVEQVFPIAEMSEQEVVRISAALESRSEHPLATALLAHACAQGEEIPLFAREFAAFPGQGVQGTVRKTAYLLGNLKLMRAQGVDVTAALPVVENAQAAGQTTVILADRRGALGVIAVSDTPRPEAASAIALLIQAGIRRQAMLTGDHARAAQAIGAQVGMTEIQAGLLPEQKLVRIRAYQQEGDCVAMIGDGVNDAPALAAADVGIVMGAMGSDTAMETADIALMGDDLSRLPYLVRLSRRTRSIIRQNVIFALLTKGLLLITTLIAGVPLWLAVLGDVGVSLVVTLNALRLMDRKQVQDKR